MRRFASLLVTSSWLCACAAGQIGGEVIGEDDAAGCEETSERPLDPDEARPGFDVPALLALSEGTFEEELAWGNSEFPGRFEPPAGTTRLHLELEVDRDSVVLSERDVAAPGGTGGVTTGIEPAEPECPDVVKFQGSLRVRTDNGALDEELPVVLRSPDGAVSEAAPVVQASVLLPLADLTGTFVVEPESGRLDGVRLDIEITESGVRAVLRTTIVEEEGTGADGVVSARPLELARTTSAP